MKRKINRILIISMLIGFCISPIFLKSQLDQINKPISQLLNTDTQYPFSNRSRLDSSFEKDWSSGQKVASKGDSLKSKLEIKSKMKNSKDSVIPRSNRKALKKIKKKNFRNKPIVIQIRI